jgi:hypothetical protein
MELELRGPVTCQGQLSCVAQVVTAEYWAGNNRDRKGLPQYHRDVQNRWKTHRQTSYYAPFFPGGPLGRGQQR